MPKQPKERKQRGRHDSVGSCGKCGWDLDRFGGCTNPECRTHEDHWYEDEDED